MKEELSMVGLEDEDGKLIGYRDRVTWDRQHLEHLSLSFLLTPIYSILPCYVLFEPRISYNISHHDRVCAAKTLQSGLHFVSVPEAQMLGRRAMYNLPTIRVRMLL